MFFGIVIKDLHFYEQNFLKVAQCIFFKTCVCYIFDKKAVKFLFHRSRYVFGIVIKDMECYAMF